MSSLRKGAGKERSRGEGWEAPPWVRRALLLGFAGAVGGVLVLALRPQPVPVDLVPVGRGQVEVAVEEDGRTRVRERYEIRAPVVGTLERPALAVGEPVEPGRLLARIRAAEPGLADAETRAGLRARLEGARAAVEGARARAEAAEVHVVEARQGLRRQELLLREGAGSPSALERARAALRTAEAEVRAAALGVQVALAEAEGLALALARPGDPGYAWIELRAPVGGHVLRVHRESGGPVAPGEPVVDLGDPGRLEVVVELLSSDAVRTRPGAEATVRSGQGDPLPARVVRVEPAGRTGVSALGIEEQRVGVILEPGGDAEGWAALGDGFRVEARIVLDRTAEVLRAPGGSVHRAGDGWVVYRAEAGRIREVPVRIGRRTPAWTEIVEGVDEGDRLVAYPSGRVEDGVRFRARR